MSKERMESLWQQGKRPQEIYDIARKEGSSYRKQDMLHDIGEARSVAYASTVGKRAHARSWYKNVFEPFRKSRKMTRKEATDSIQKWRDESYTTVEEYLDGQAYEDFYNEY